MCCQDNARVYTCSYTNCCSLLYNTHTKYTLSNTRDIYYSHSVNSTDLYMYGRHKGALPPHTHARAYTPFSIQSSVKLIEPICASVYIQCMCTSTHSSHTGLSVHCVYSGMQLHAHCTACMYVCMYVCICMYVCMYGPVSTSWQTGTQWHACCLVQRV